MMARVALGSYRGALLAAPPGMAASFALVIGAAVVRVVAGAVGGPNYTTAVGVAGLLWTLSFTIFLYRYAPMLVKPRGGRTGGLTMLGFGWGAWCGAAARRGRWGDVGAPTMDCQTCKLGAASGEAACPFQPSRQTGGCRAAVPRRVAEPCLVLAGRAGCFGLLQRIGR